jgi:hypothetical protein
VGPQGHQGPFSLGKKGSPSRIFLLRGGPPRPSPTRCADELGLSSRSCPQVGQPPDTLLQSCSFLVTESPTFEKGGFPWESRLGGRPWTTSDLMLSACLPSGNCSPLLGLPLSRTSPALSRPALAFTDQEGVYTLFPEKSCLYTRFPLVF